MEASNYKRILIVEDEPGLRLSLALLLEREGYSVRVAADGGEGLAVLPEFRPDVVVSDVMMPGLDGIEMVREMRASLWGCTIPIIFYTNYPCVQLKPVGKGDGVTCLPKAESSFKDLLCQIEGVAGKSGVPQSASIR